MVAARRFDVVLVELDPTRGSEIQKTRPALVISPNELNRSLRTMIIAPMTTGGHAYPWRVPVEFEGKLGHIALDQVRTIDEIRVRRRLGRIDEVTADATLRTLIEMFSP